MINYRKYRYWIPVIVAGSFVCGTAVGYFLDGDWRKSSGERKLEDVLEQIQANYVDNVDMDSLIEKSLPAILENLDPHSAYIKATDLETVNQSLKGSFGGVGIHFQIYRDTLNVVEVNPGGPADKAGVQAGDRIVTVDNKEISGKQLTEEKVREMLRGKHGSAVRLGIYRPSAPGKLINSRVIRGDIPLNSVDASYMLSDDIGYIKVSTFSNKTYDEFLQALNSLRIKGANNYIIDLRGNTGGYMETAIMMVNEFLPESKVILSTKSTKMPEGFVMSDGYGAFTRPGVTVLIDEMSASSSEIFAGALQDHDRALIIGRRSFGKGLVQRPIAFPDGSELRLTVQRYYTPSGRSIQKDYKGGNLSDYEYEVYNRYRSGEVLNEDSMKLRKDLLFHTDGGRAVYGGGGIAPDIFVPNDTSGITNYYLDVANKGLIMKFAYEYCDLNRADLKKVKNVDQLDQMLPSNDILLNSFVYYAKTQGVPARWYYIKLSRNLIVSQIKANIARNVLGLPAYYNVINKTDSTLNRAVTEIKNGNAKAPVRINNHSAKAAPKVAQR